MRLDLNPDKLLAAYAAGIFPMADDHGLIHWLAPDPRAVIDLEEVGIPRSLRTIIRRGVFEVTVNRAFSDIIRACADRPEGTWISAQIVEAYGTLHRLGFAHSVEAWKEGRLAGGLYGVAIGAAFFGESMFHRVPDASKVALTALIERMQGRRYALLDVQFVTEHLRRFGATEISRAEYEKRLHEAIRQPRAFDDTLNPTALRPPQ